MLEKLSNINSDIRNSQSGISYYNAGNSGIPYKLKAGDTLSQSEAVKFLRNIRWSIDELVLKKEKLFIRFSAEDITFETLLDLNHFNGEFAYLIKAKNPGSGKIFVIDMRIFISYKIPKSISGKFQALHVLLRRIFLLDVQNELSIDDSKAIDYLFDNIEDKLYENMNELSHILLIFLHKYANLKFNISELPGKQLRLYKIKAVRE